MPNNNGPQTTNPGTASFDMRNGTRYKHFTKPSVGTHPFLTLMIPSFHSSQYSWALSQLNSSGVASDSRYPKDTRVFRPEIRPLSASSAKMSISYENSASPPYSNSNAKYMLFRHIGFILSIQFRFPRLWRYHHLFLTNYHLRKRHFEKNMASDKHSKDCAVALVLVENWWLPLISNHAVVIIRQYLKLKSATKSSQLLHPVTWHTTK